MIFVISELRINVNNTEMLTVKFTIDVTTTLDIANCLG